MEYITVEEARERPGLRLIVLASVPSPWSESAKGLLRIAKIPHVGVRASVSKPEAWDWLGVKNSPAAVYNAEAPRTGWAEILALVERLAPNTNLIPKNPLERAMMLGYCHELLGERGLVWCRRLDMVHQSIESQGERSLPVAVAQYFGSKYGYRGPADKEHIDARIRSVLAMFGAQLRVQKKLGGWTYLGENISAVDVYSAAAMQTFVPQPEELCPMQPIARRAYGDLDSSTQECIEAWPELLEHRDRMYTEALELPVQL